MFRGTRQKSTRRLQTFTGTSHSDQGYKGANLIRQVGAVAPRKGRKENEMRAGGIWLFGEPKEENEMTVAVALILGALVIALEIWCEINK